MATLNFRQVRNFSQTLFMEILDFTGKDDGPTIEEFIQRSKSTHGKYWRIPIVCSMRDEAKKWWLSLDHHQKMTNISDAEFEKLFLDKWSRAKKKENETHKRLFATGVSLLQVHALIQKEKIIVSINPSCKQNLININLAKRLQVPAKHIETAQIDNKDFQVYKDLKISMDKYVLHGDFYTSDMDNMDVVLGYPWMESVSTININV